MPASWPGAAMAERRQAAERRGRMAETAALWALRLKGYRLLARRYRSRVGEIDLIMRRGDVTCFVEVKSRVDAGLSLQSVTDAQARRIAAAARTWMGRDPRAAAGTCRFDIVAVSPYHWPRHIENAFYGAD
jgi:putative endonuclease